VVAGNIDRLNSYVAEKGLRQNQLFLSSRLDRAGDGRAKEPRAVAAGSGGRVGKREAGRHDRISATAAGEGRMIC
jgi:hypothetical protein